MENVTTVNIQVPTRDYYNIIQKELDAGWFTKFIYNGAFIYTYILAVGIILIALVFIVVNMIYKDILYSNIMLYVTITACFLIMCIYSILVNTIKNRRNEYGPIIIKKE